MYGSFIFVNEDLAQETLDKREEQRPKFEEARRNGKIAYFVFCQKTELSVPVN